MYSALAADDEGRQWLERFRRRFEGFLEKQGAAVPDRAEEVRDDAEVSDGQATPLAAGNEHEEEEEERAHVTSS